MIAVAPTAGEPENDVDVPADTVPVVDRSPKMLSRKNPWVSRNAGPPKENVASAGPMISSYSIAMDPRIASSGRNFGMSSGEYDLASIGIVFVGETGVPTSSSRATPSQDRVDGATEGPPRAMVSSPLLPGCRRPLRV